MPWSPAQHRLFEWAAHNPQAAQAQGYHIPPTQAAKMAHEGIATNPMDTPVSKVASALAGRKKKA